MKLNGHCETDLKYWCLLEKNLKVVNNDTVELLLNSVRRGDKNKNYGDSRWTLLKHAY